MDPVDEQAERIRQNLEDWSEEINNGTISYADFEDIFEDRDPFEFL